MMRKAIPGAAASLVLSGAALAQPTCWQVPYADSADLQPFIDLFARARAMPVRILMLGDSQETTPGGGGVVYVPRLNLELWLRYGGTPESPFLPAGGSTGEGPPADWLGRTMQATPGPIAAATPAGWLPPGLSAYTYGATGYGCIMSLEPDASFTDPGVQGAGAFRYLATSGGVSMDVLGVQSATSGDIRWKARPHTSGVPSYWTPIASSGVIATLTADRGNPAIVRTLGPLSLAGEPYMHVELSGVSDAHRCTIIGARYRAVSSALGVTVSSFSAGGYTSSHFLLNHGNCGAVLSSLRFDAVILAYGANDAVSGVSAQQFGSNEAAIITTLRSWIRPDLPVLLFGDPFRQGLTPGQQFQYDRYAGAQQQLAQSLPRVLVVNGRRLLEEQGWSASGTPPYFLQDQVHYTAAGSRAKAHAEARILEQSVIFPCYPDADRSGTISVNDFIAFLNLFAAGDAYANCDRSSAAPTLNVGDFVCYLNKYAQGCGPQ